MINTFNSLNNTSSLLVLMNMALKMVLDWVVKFSIIAGAYILKCESEYLNLQVFKCGTACFRLL